MPRVCIIGLDCLTPQLTFDSYHGDLPHLEQLAAAGAAGRLESSMPPITVPAWAAMVTGVDPGMLGVYGFRGRADHGYNNRHLASSRSFAQPTLWQRLSAHGLRSRILTVPQTFPPQPFDGVMVSGILTPGPEAAHTHPPEARAELEALTGGFRFDVEQFRSRDKERLLRDIYAITEQDFRVARDWLKRDDWDLFMMVELGPDRMHHGFWRYQAEDHPSFEPGHRYADAVRDYYVHLDRHVGSLLELLRDDDIVFVVSDHGAQTLQGCVALNQWLLERGDLVLNSNPTTPTHFDIANVDWSRTRAWADGGYVGRVYFNIRGREPQGIIESDGVDAYAEALRTDLRAIPRPDGQPMQTVVHRPDEIYREVRGVAPDLTVLFDDLAFRAIGSVGQDSVHVPLNDTGPDDANHARHGVIIMKDGRGARALPSNASLYDVAPTVLDRLGLPVPEEMVGRVLP